MITQKEFIEKRLRKLVNVYKSIKTGLFFDNDTETFYVQIFPKKHFNNKEGLIEVSSDIVFDFINEFPDDSLVFITEESVLEPSSFVTTISGCQYENNSSSLLEIIKRSFINHELDLKKSEFEFSGEYNYALAA